MLKNLFGKKNKDYFLEFDEKKEADVSTQESAKPAPVKNKKSAKQDSPSEVDNTQEAKETAKPAPIKPQPSVSYDTPEWVKAIKNYSNQTINSSSSVAESSNFAGQYVTNNVAMSRRRPGPSLNKFKKIASEIYK